MTEKDTRIGMNHKKADMLQEQVDQLQDLKRRHEKAANMLQEQIYQLQEQINALKSINEENEVEKESNPSVEKVENPPEKKKSTKNKLLYFPVYLFLFVQFILFSLVAMVGAFDDTYSLSLVVLSFMLAAIAVWSIHRIQKNKRFLKGYIATVIVSFLSLPIVDIYLPSPSFEEQTALEKAKVPISATPGLFSPSEEQKRQAEAPAKQKKRTETPTKQKKQARFPAITVGKTKNECFSLSRSAATSARAAAEIGDKEAYEYYQSVYDANYDCQF